MKKIIQLTAILLAISLGGFSQAQKDPEPIAKEIIKAYKNKDAQLLKKHLSGIMVYAVNENYFDSDDAKPMVEVAKSWNGKIKEIRYSKGDLMGKTVLIASAWFSDNPNGNLNTVLLSSYGNSDWKALGMGITDMSKEEFEEGTLEIPGDKQEKGKEAMSFKDFSVEMANGEKYENPNFEKLEESLENLDEENFFLILNGPDGFLQTTTSEEGYIVQYSDDSGMYEAESYFSFDELIDIFEAYLEGKDWKSMDSWVEM